jgi:hypothetical protein
MARANAGALYDPFVRSVDRLGQLVIGHTPLRKGGSDTGDNRAKGHYAASWLKA